MEAGSSGAPVHSARLGLASVPLWMLAACRSEMEADHRCGRRPEYLIKQ